MRVISTVVLATLLGAGCATDVPVTEIPDAQVAAETESSIGFDSVEPIRIEERELTDDYVDRLMDTLDELLAGEDLAADSAKAAGLHLWRFGTRIRTGSVTDEQVSRVTAHFQELAGQYPEAADQFERAAWLVENLRIGAVAPNIVGKDAYGGSFELEDYRGKVVVLVFGGQWCGPCRSEYPYQRLMTEVHADRPFAIVGVNSDSLAIAQTYQAENNLDYRSFWDGPTTKGPIATRWMVTGWPTIYILDAEGRIRFTGARHEDTLKAVTQLLAEIPRDPTPARPTQSPDDGSAADSTSDGT